MSEELFDRLAAILTPYRQTMQVTTEAPGHLVLDRGDGTGVPADFFAMVKQGQRGVAFHLMPVYVCPELLAKISEKLRQRMTGKSCFNFTHIDAELFDELTLLTAHGAARMAQDDYLAAR